MTYTLTYSLCEESQRADKVPLPARNVSYASFLRFLGVSLRKRQFRHEQAFLLCAVSMSPASLDCDDKLANDRERANGFRKITGENALPPENARYKACSTVTLLNNLPGKHAEARIAKIK